MKPLTSRELEILELMAQGHTNCEIAHLLCIEKTTVITHRYKMMKKFQAKNACHLICLALELKILSHKASKFFGG